MPQSPPRPSPAPASWTKAAEAAAGGAIACGSSSPPLPPPQQQPSEKTDMEQHTSLGTEAGHRSDKDEQSSSHRMQPRRRCRPPVASVNSPSDAASISLASNNGSIDTAPDSSADRKTQVVEHSTGPSTASSNTNSAGPSPSLFPSSMSVSNNGGGGRIHPPTSSSELPYMRRVRGLTPSVITAVAANTTAVAESTQISSASFLVRLAALQESTPPSSSSSPSSSMSPCKPSPASPQSSAAPPLSSSSVEAKEMLSPASYARQRRCSMGPTTINSAEHYSNAEATPPRRPMARHATMPVTSLPSMQLQRVHGDNDDNDGGGRKSSSNNNKGDPLPTEAPSVSVPEGTATTTATNMTFSDFTLTSNALLRRGTVAVTVQSDDALNGSLAPRRSNTMASLPTQHQHKRCSQQHQQQQHGSATRQPPPSPAPSLHADSPHSSPQHVSKSRVATAGAPSGSALVLPFVNATTTAHDRGQRSQCVARKLRFPHDGTAAALEEGTATLPEDAPTLDAVPPVAAVRAGGSAKAPPPPLLSLSTSSAPTATAATVGLNAALFVTPPPRAALLPSRPRRSSVVGNPGSPHNQQSSNNNSSGGGGGGGGRRGPTVELVLSVSEEETYELSVSDGLRSAGPGSVERRSSVMEGRGQQQQSDVASSSTPTASTPVLLHASFDGFAGVLSADPSVVSSSSLSSLTQTTPLSTKKAEDQAVTAGVSLAAPLQAPRPSGSAATTSSTGTAAAPGLPLLPLTSVLADSTGASPTAKSKKQRSISHSSGSWKTSSPLGRARAHDAAQQQQQQHRLSDASAYTLSPTSSGPSQSALNDTVALQPPAASAQSQQQQYQQQLSKTGSTEARCLSHPVDATACGSQCGQDTPKSGIRGTGYTTTGSSAEGSTPAPLVSPAVMDRCHEGARQESLKVDDDAAASPASPHASSTSSGARLSTSVLTPLPDSALFSHSSAASPQHTEEDERQRQQLQQQRNSHHLTPTRTSPRDDSAADVPAAPSARLPLWSCSTATKRSTKPQDSAATTIPSPPPWQSGVCATTTKLPAAPAVKGCPPRMHSASLSTNNSVNADNDAGQSLGNLVATTPRTALPGSVRPPLSPDLPSTTTTAAAQTAGHGTVVSLWSPLNGGSRTSVSEILRDAARSCTSGGGGGGGGVCTTGAESGEADVSHHASPLSPENANAAYHGGVLAVPSSPLDLGSVVITSRSSTSPVMSVTSLASLSPIADIIMPIASLTARRTSGAAAYPHHRNSSSSGGSVLMHPTSTTSPLPRGPNVSGGHSPMPFRSVAGLLGGSSPPPLPGDPPSLSGSVSMTMIMTTPRNDNETSPCPPHPGSSATTSAAGGMAGRFARTPNNNLTSTPPTNRSRASPVFSGFGLATHTASTTTTATTINACMASIPASASLSLPAHMRSNSSPNAAATALTQSLAATPLLFTQRSTGSFSTTSSMGAFVLQGSNTAVMMRRGIPHRLTEVSLPDHSRSGSMSTTATSTGEEVSGLFEREGHVDRDGDEVDDDDLMSSATHRANGRALQLSKRGTTGGMESGRHSRRISSGGGGGGRRRRRSLLKPGTAIELAILNGTYTRRPSAISLVHGGGGGLSVMGRSGNYSAGPGQSSWRAEGEPLEVSLSCAASFTVSSTSAAESYVSSSFGSVSHAVLKYDPPSTSGGVVGGAKGAGSGLADGGGGSGPTSAVPPSHTAVPSASLSRYPSAGVDHPKENGDDVPCALYAAAPIHFHFYQTSSWGGAQPSLQSLSSPLQLPRYQHQQQQQSASVSGFSAGDCAAATAANGAIAPQQHRREKRHHRYVRVHHRRRCGAAHAASTHAAAASSSSSPPPDAEHGAVPTPPPPPPASTTTIAVAERQAPPLAPDADNARFAESSLLRESSHDAATDKATKKEAPSVQAQIDVAMTPSSPPPAGASTIPRKPSTSPMKRQTSPSPSPVDDAVYSPHLSTSSLLYYDDVDSDAVDDVYYQLEKRLFPVTAEQELQRRFSLPGTSRSSQEMRDKATIHSSSSANDDKGNAKDKGKENSEQLDSLFTVLKVPLRLNLRGGFHLSDYYAPCPVCHPVMQELAAASASTSTSTTTTSTTDADSSVRCRRHADQNCAVCSCCAATSYSTRGAESVREESVSPVSSLSTSSLSSTSSSSSYAASSPSAASVLSSVISTMGIGFTFGSGARLTSATPPPSHRPTLAGGGASGGGVNPTPTTTTTTIAAGVPRVSSRGSLPSFSTAAASPNTRTYTGRCSAHNSSSGAAAAAGNHSSGCNSSRANNVTVVSPKDDGSSLVPAVPSPLSVKDIPIVPSRYRVEGDSSGRNACGGARDATRSTRTTEQSISATSAAVTGVAAMRAGQTLSSILQHGGSVASGTLANTASLSPIKLSSADVPHQQQQQQHFPSLPSLSPFGPGLFPAFSSAPHSGRSSQVMYASQAMVLTSARLGSHSLTTGGGGGGVNNNNVLSTSIRHLSRYRRTRQRHRPALIVARRRGYRTGGGGGGAGLRSQYSSFMKQRLLCVRINDKFTYIDPKRATGTAKLVADAALLAERQKRAEAQRQRRHAERQRKREERAEERRVARLRAATAAVSWGKGMMCDTPLQDCFPTEQQTPRGDEVDGGEVASARETPQRICCRRCHRPLRSHHHHRHHTAAQSVEAKTGEASPTAHRTHRHHHRHHHRSHDLGRNNNSDLLSQNASGRWEEHGTAAASRTAPVHAAAAATAAVDKDMSNVSIRSGSVSAFQQQQPRPFGDGLVCFAAKQSPAPKTSNVARTSAEGVLTSALRRADAAGGSGNSSRSNALHCVVIASESPPRPQRSPTTAAAAASAATSLVSRTAGRVAHPRVPSSSSSSTNATTFCSLSGVRVSVPAAAPSLLQSNSSVAAAVIAASCVRSSNSCGSNLSEALEHHELSAHGVNLSRDFSAAGSATTTATMMLRAADGTALAVPRNYSAASYGEEESLCQPVVHQRTDSVLLSVYASGNHLVPGSFLHMSDVTDDGERRSEPSLSRLPPFNASMQSHGVGEEETGRGESTTGVHARSGSSNNNNSTTTAPRPGYRLEEREGVRAAGRHAPSSSDVAEMPYSVSSHNLQFHVFNSGRSSSAVSTPPPLFPFSLPHQHNSGSSYHPTSSIAAEMSLGTAAAATAAAATTEEQQGNCFVSPSVALAGGLLRQDGSGAPHPRRRHSRSRRSLSHSARHSRTLTGGGWPQHHHHHHHIPSSTSPPPDTDVAEEDLLNTALAAYPQFPARSDSRA